MKILDKYIDKLYKIKNVKNKHNKPIFEKINVDVR